MAVDNEALVELLFEPRLQLLKRQIDNDARLRPFRELLRCILKIRKHICVELLIGERQRHGRVDRFAHGLKNERQLPHAVYPALGFVESPVIGLKIRRFSKHIAAVPVCLPLYCTFAKQNANADQTIRRSRLLVSSKRRG